MIQWELKDIFWGPSVVCLNFSQYYISKLCGTVYCFIINEPTFTSFYLTMTVFVRDSSAVRWLFVRLAGAVGRQSTLHKENSGFAAPTLGQHISTFRGYQILLAHLTRRVMWAIAITWRLSSSYVVNFLKIFSSESTRPMETKIGQNHHYDV